MDNTAPVTPLPLLDAALEAGRALGLTIQVMQRAPQLGRARADALVRIGRGGEEAIYAVDVRHTLRPATLGAAIAQLERLGQQALLVADYVTPALADELKARRVAFLDAAGNAYLEQPHLLIWVKGQKPVDKPIAPEIGRAFQPTGLQVVFALLCNPQTVNRPYRELAAMAGAAHGTVGWVMQDLQQLGFIGDLRGKRGTRRLFQGVELSHETGPPRSVGNGPRFASRGQAGRFGLNRLEGDHAGEPSDRATRLTGFGRKRSDATSGGPRWPTH